MNELFVTFPDFEIIYDRPYREILAKSDYAIVGRERINQESLTPRLKAISKYGVGVDNIDFDDCKKNSTHVFFTPGVNKEEVVELTLGQMIVLSRNMIGCSKLLENKIWSKNGGRSLSELTIAIIGVGNIGTLLARVLTSTFRPKILLCDILDKNRLCQEINALQVPYEQCLREADLISFHVPFDLTTQNLFNSHCLKFVKRGVMIINNSRGECVNELAIIEGLKEGIIGQVALDVFAEEPLPIDSGLTDFPQVFLTPHIAGNSEAAVLKMGRAAITGLLAAIAKI